MLKDKEELQEAEKIPLSSLRKYFIVTLLSVILLAGTLLWAALSTAPITPTSYPRGLDGDQFKTAYELVRQWYIEATVYRNLNLLLLIVGVILPILLSQTSALTMEAKSKYCFLAIVSAIATSVNSQSDLKGYVSRLDTGQVMLQNAIDDYRFAGAPAEIARRKRINDLTDPLGPFIQRIKEARAFVYAARESAQSITPTPGES